jgi:dihydrofolate reductase
VFGPGRGPWPDDAWKGWGTESPPIIAPSSCSPTTPGLRSGWRAGRRSISSQGGIREALTRATEAAGGKDVRLGGGVATIRQYLRERLVDEMHLVVSPVLLGSREALFAGLDLTELGYECAEHVSSAPVTHVVLKKRDR